MPYKNPEDKKKWRKNNRDKARQQSEAWRRRQGMQTREERLKALKEKSESRKKIEEQKRKEKAERRAAERERAIKAKDKICRLCRERKLKSKFPKDKDGKDGYKNTCHSCKSKQIRSNLEWHHRRQRGGELWYTRAANNIRQREGRHGVETIVDADLVRRVYEKFGYQCFKCEKNEDLCIDHHNPLNEGYQLKDFNAVVLCRSCNAIKNTMSVREFYTGSEVLKLSTNFGVDTRS